MLLLICGLNNPQISIKRSCLSLTVCKKIFCKKTETNGAMNATDIMKNDPRSKNKVTKKIQLDFLKLSYPSYKYKMKIFFLSCEG
jgi:hypothetical protein